MQMQMIASAIEVLVRARGMLRHFELVLEHGTPISPYAWRVRLALAQLRLPWKQSGSASREYICRASAGCHRVAHAAVFSGARAWQVRMLRNLRP